MKIFFCSVLGITLKRRKIAQNALWRGIFNSTFEMAPY